MPKGHYSRPVIPLLLALIGGIVAGDLLPGWPAPAWVLATLAAAGNMLRLRQVKAVAVLPLALFFPLGYLLQQPWVAPRFPAQHMALHVGEAEGEIRGTLRNDPQVTAVQRCRFILETEWLTRGAERVPCLGLLQVTVGGPPPDLRMGDRIRFSARIRPIHNFNNPGGFDYRRHMAFQKVWGSAFVRGETLVREEGASGSSAARMVTRLRQHIGALIAERSHGEATAVLKALVIGDSSGITPELREVFSRAGIAHLLSISGLHIGVVAAAAFFMARGLLARCRPLLWRAAVRKTSALFAILPVLAYGVVAGMPPATARSVIMVLAALAALMVEREQDTLNALALAALIMLVLDPPILFAASFQLSFAAVGAIVLGGTLPGFSRAGRGGQVQRGAIKAAGLVWVSLVATLATTPLTLRYFHQLQLLGPLTNLFFIPVLGALVVVTMLAAVTLILCGITPALHLVGVCDAITGWCIDAARRVAALPFAALETVWPSLIEMAALYLLLGAGLWLLRQWRGGARRGPALRHASMVALVAALVLVADVSYWVRARYFFPELRVTVLDVGQGSATLLEFPGGETALVDGGGFGEGTGFDTGALIVDPLLRSRKILTLDTLILTHANSDHLGGLPHLASHFQVRTLLTNGESDGSPTYERLMAIAREKEIATPALSEVPRVWTAGGAQLAVLYPPADFKIRKVRERWRDLNNNSLVLQVRLGQDRLLLPGDIHAPAETELVALRGSELASNVLLAPHHGSRTSSSAALLEAVKPREVICSVGWQNRYRFPHAEVLERYRQREARIWRTDLQGAIEIRTRGAGVSMRSMLDAPHAPAAAEDP